MHFMPYLPWVSTFYYKRERGDYVIDLVIHAMVEAGFRMDIAMPEAVLDE